MAKEKTYRFGDDEITAPEEMSVDTVRKIWEDVHPSLANAEFREVDGAVVFEVKAGTKG
jgi:hypothetical protein